jgi:hypothetical protein
LRVCGSIPEGPLLKHLTRRANHRHSFIIAGILEPAPGNRPRAFSFRAAVRTSRVPSCKKYPEIVDDRYRAGAGNLQIILREGRSRQGQTIAMTPIKYLLATFIAASWYASAFLYYLLPTVSFWLPLISFACWIPLFIFSCRAVFRRNWRTVAIFSITWGLAVLPIGGPESVDRFRFWLNVQGFRIRVAPVERYLSSRCKFIEYVEDDIEQQLGECESINRSLDFRDVVFFDTTGQLALPPKQRTQGWKDAMYYNFSPHRYLTDKAVAVFSFRGFYVVVIPTDEEEG